MDQLDMDERFANRYLNAGFSGGRRNRTRSSRPRSWSPRSPCSTRSTPGWTSTACRTSPTASTLLRDEQGTGILQITHYQRILDYVEPDHVHVMIDGEIAKSGDASLAEELEDKGYDWVREEVYEAA